MEKPKDAVFYRECVDMQFVVRGASRLDAVACFVTGHSGELFYEELEKGIVNYTVEKRKKREEMRK